MCLNLPFCKEKKNIPIDRNLFLKLGHKQTQRDCQQILVKAPTPVTCPRGVTLALLRRCLIVPPFTLFLWDVTVTPLLTSDGKMAPHCVLISLPHVFLFSQDTQRQSPCSHLFVGDRDEPLLGQFPQRADVCPHVQLASHQDHFGVGTKLLRLTLPLWTDTRITHKSQGVLT